MVVLFLAVAGCHSAPPIKPAIKTRNAEPPIATMSLKALFGEGPSTRPAPATQPVAKAKINPDAMLAYFQGKSQLLEKDQKGAMESLQKAVKLDPNYLPAQSLLTQLYYEQGQFTSAERHARAVLALDPGDPMASYVLGSALLKTGDFKKAAGYLYRAVVVWNRSDQPPTFDGLLAAFKLGGALSGRGYLHAAIEIYQPLLVQMERLDGDATVQDVRIKRMVQIYRPGMYLLLGDYSFKLQRLADAMDYYRKGEKIAEVKNQARQGIVRCYAAQNKLKDATDLLATLATEQGIDEQLLDLYRQLYPDNAWATKVAEVYRATTANAGLGANIAEQLQKAGNDALAIQVLQKVLTADPSSGQALWLLVKSFEKSGKIDQAARILLDATIHADRKSTAIPAALKNVDAPLGEKLAHALEKTAVGDNERHAQKYLIALAWQTAGRFDRADADYRAALELKKDFLPAYLGDGQLLLQERRWAEAGALATRAMDGGLTNPGILYIRGSARMEQNRIKEAIDDLEKARRLNPDSDQAMLALAECYLRSEEPSRAFDILKQIIGNNMAGPQTMGRLVQMLLEAESLALGESVLQQYAQRFGQDGDYRMLMAKVAYLKDLNATKYREQLIQLQKEGLGSGALDREMAELEFDLGNYGRCIGVADRALDAGALIGPRDYQRLLQLQAFSYWKLLDYNQAERVWQKLLAVWPDQDSIRVGLARMYLDAQEFAKARPLVSQLLTREKNTDQQAQYQLWLINCLMGQDDLKESLKAIDAWLAAAPKDDRARLRRMKVECLVRAEQFPAAVKLLDQFIAQKEHPVLQWQQMLISVLLTDDQAPAALARAEQFLAAADAKSRPFIEGLKVPVLLQLKKYDQAIALAEKRDAAASPEQKFAAILLRINCCQQAGRYDGAIEIARRALAGEKPDSMFAFTLRQQIAYTFQLAGRYAEGEKFILDQARTPKPELRNQWQQVLVSFYSAAGKPEGATKVLEEILATNPNLAWACNSLGYSLADQNRNLDRAESLIRKALASEPGSGAYLDSLAWACFRRGNFSVAYKYARMARLAMTDPDPVVLDHLGDICLKLGRPGEAKAAWEQAVRACRNRDPGTVEPGLPDRAIKKLKSLGK